MLHFLGAEYPLQRCLGNKPVLMVSGESAGLQKNKKVYLNLSTLMSQISTANDN